MACRRTEQSETSTINTGFRQTVETVFHSTRPPKRVGANLLIRVGLALIGTLLSGSQGHALTLGRNEECRHGTGKVKRIIGTLNVEITPTVDKDALNEPICHLVVSDSHGRQILSEVDSSFKILLDDRDVNGDGIPDVVLEAYSGGAHCCWTYYIISLGSKPGLIKKFENNRDATFFWNKENRRIEIVTLDGNFDYFDGLCHACTPFPVVYLRLDGSDLVDISPSSVGDYDDIISQNQKALTARELRHLRTLKGNPSDDEGARKTIYRALSIVF